MVKTLYKGMLVLGINRQEMEHLQQGQPLHIKLVDLDERLKGQQVMIIPGESDEQLAAAAKKAAELLKAGRPASSRIILPN